jgi:poly(A) polymerase
MLLLPIDLNIFPRTRGVYIVGGSVRDLLCGRKPIDYDLAVRDHAEAFAGQFAVRIAGHVVEFGKPGLSIRRVIGGGLIFDIMPVNGASIEADLGRRDFTINAMALELSSGKLIDPNNGRNDLAAKTIRMVSPAAFEADPVRLVRAYRMAAAFESAIEPATQAAIARYANLIDRSASERIREELFKILHTAASHSQLAGMARSGLLFAILPELHPLKADRPSGPQPCDLFTQTLAAYCYLENCMNSQAAVSEAKKNRYFPDADSTRAVLIKWAALFHKIGRLRSRQSEAEGPPDHDDDAPDSAFLARQICQRLKFSKRQSDRISLLVRLHRRPLALFRRHQKNEDIERQFIRLFMEFNDALPDILLLGLAEYCGSRRAGDQAGIDFNEFIAARLRQYNQVLRPRAQLPAAVTGRDLMRHFGLKPSAAFKHILLRLEEERLAGCITSRRQAFEMVRKLLSGSPQEDPGRGQNL